MDTSALLIEEVLDAIPGAVAILYGNRIVQLNVGFSRLFGYAPAECLGQDLDGLVMPDGRLYESDIIAHSIKMTGRCTMDTVRRTALGALLDVSVLCSRVRLGPDAAGLLVMYQDTSRQHQEEARLRHTALHDSLTGLANRALFLDRVNLTMARLRRRPDRGFAVLFLDLDGFKQVNDTLGHHAGDSLLLQVAARLSASLRPQDTVARFGGDEFALLLDESAGAADAEQVAARVQREIQRPIEIAGIGNLVTASIGIALAGHADLRVDALMQQADSAMYAAKAAGKACHVVYTPALIANLQAG